MQPPPPAQRSDLILPLLDTRLLRAFQILEEVCLASGFRSGAAVSRRGYDYFFRFDVFFATFLVAFAVFFAFFAFLAMSSSSKKIGSVNLHTPSIDMHNIETISQMQN
jgi:hypothetical protein